jgi:hypothetical protein
LVAAGAGVAGVGGVGPLAVLAGSGGIWLLLTTEMCEATALVSLLGNAGVGAVDAWWIGGAGHATSPSTVGLHRSQYPRSTDAGAISSWSHTEQM